MQIIVEAMLATVHFSNGSNFLFGTLLNFHDSDAITIAFARGNQSTFLYTYPAMTNCTATSPASSPKAAYKLAA